MLIVMGGLPGVGKTAISRELARATHGVHLRIDSIEQALRASGYRVEGEGYAVAYAVAADNLALGLTVIADCVNPWLLTRAERREQAFGALPGFVILPSPARRRGPPTRPPATRPRLFLLERCPWFESTSGSHS